MGMEPGRVSEPVDDPQVAVTGKSGQPSPYAPPTAPPLKKSSGPLVLVIVLVVMVALLPILGVISALAIYGVRKYIFEAKRAEGRHAVTALAQGIVRCAGSSGKLPETSRSVPPELGMISGKKYMSHPAEWDDPAFRCAGFSMSSPQYFQYQWVKSSDETGTVHGKADLDADGTPEIDLELEVRCSAGRCESASLPSENR
jgi:type IV pilus assembly protein PilA